LMCGPWHKAAEMGLSLMTPDRVLSEYNEDLIFYFCILRIKQLIRYR